MRIPVQSKHKDKGLIRSKIHTDRKGISVTVNSPDTDVCIRLLSRGNKSFTGEKSESDVKR